MKKLIILFFILQSVLQHGDALAQLSSMHTINGNKAVFQITTDKSFTLNFVDTPEVHEIMMHLVYNSDSETHKLWIIKNVKTTDSTRIDTVDKFTLHDPVIYQELKNTLNKIAQNKFGIQRPVSDASISAIYLWLHHIRHFDDRAPLSGELILNEYIMIIKDKGIQEQYKDYYERSSLVQKKANEYSAAIAKLERQKVLKKELTDRLIDAIITDRKMLDSLLRDTNRHKKIIELEKEYDSLSDSADDVYKKISQSYKKMQTIINKELDYQKYSKDSEYITFENRYDSLNQVYNRIRNKIDEISFTINLLNIPSRDSMQYVEVLISLDKYISEIKQGKDKTVITDFQKLKEIQKARYLLDSLRSHYSYYYDSFLRRNDQYFRTNKNNQNFRTVYWKDTVDSIINAVHKDDVIKARADKRQQLLFTYTPSLLLQIEYNIDDWTDINSKIDETNKNSQHELNGLKTNNIYKVDKISLQFERGFMERIQVWITYNDKQEIFENIYAIGFSSINNYKTFKSIKLFARNTTSAYPYIFLSDVIANYDNMLQNYTRDYCPADTAINNVNPSGKDKILKLRNERLVNLFDSKIYTDLRGIAESQPNGLVQVEVNKRFNLNTERHQLGSTRSNYGRFNFLNLWGALTKIENKDKLLSLRNDKVIQNNVILSPSYATTLDFLRYEMLSLGGELNLLLFDLPDSKFTIYADFGTRYGFTKVRDSVYEITNNLPLWDSGAFNEREAHTLTLFPRIKAEIFAEKRVGFTFSYQYNYTYLFSNNYFKQVASYAKSQTSNTLLDTRARGSHMMEMYVRIQASEDNDNKFFVRARLFLQRGDVNTSFSQLQLGYSYNLFYKK